MPDFTIHWHQAEPELVDAWEFSFQRVGSREWEFVQRVEPVDGCVDCFEAQVELPRLALLVRSRSISGDEFSEWSQKLSVYSPEPGFGMMISLSVLALLLVQKSKAPRPLGRRASTIIR